MVDAQLDEFQRDVLKIQFDPLDVPQDQFVIAGKAWLMCRKKEADPEKFGFGKELRGMWFIRGNVVRDFLSLNKLELLPWDGWAFMEEGDQGTAADDMKMLDHISELALAGNEAFQEIRSIHKNHDRLCMEADWDPMAEDAELVEDIGTMENEKSGKEGDHE